MYSLEDIKVLKGAEVIRRRPEMYFGSNGPTPESISSRILNDALVLGSKFATVKCIDNWWVVSAEIDWLSIGGASRTDFKSLFNRMIPFPEAGVNSIRSEVFAGVYSSVILLGGTAGSILIKGESSDEEEFGKVTSSIYPRKRILGFKFDSGI